MIFGQVIKQSANSKFTSFEQNVAHFANIIFAYNDFKPKEDETACSKMMMLYKKVYK